MQRKSLVVGAGILAVIVLIGIAAVGLNSAVFWFTAPSPTASNTQTGPSNSSLRAEDDRSVLTDVLGVETPGSSLAHESLGARILEIVLRLCLAVIFSAILAFRPRQDVPLFRRSLFVSQTQILLSVVAAALMMIVGDNAARAFAIFAAVSLVRFRTNIRDPKEITVLLISLALGLAAGVGRWELGLALCLFALALLWLLEYKESEQVFRSMELTVKTRDPDGTQQILKKIFKRMKIDTEVRELEPPDEKRQIGSIIYYLNLPLNITTDRLTDRINAADPENIEGIQWSQKKSATDIYQ